jgi:endoglucanase
MDITPAMRERHRRWLQELTQVPTAAGRERRVIAWIEGWAAEREWATLSRDAAGNLTLAMRDEPAGGTAAPVYFTAHLDHPAFVVERVIGPGTVQVAFRGGVMDDYFADARVTLHGADGVRTGATLTGRADSPAVGIKSYIAELDGPADPRPGDIATWELPPARVDGDLLYTNACDDLAAAAAALAAFDVLGGTPLRGVADPDKTVAERRATPVRLLFTRAEEIGFVGALAACRAGTIPKYARVIALENSRSFDDSPIGGGPIVRVGDRLSIFSPSLTAAVAAVAERIAGGPPPTASQKLSSAPAWKWQRKLMAGGACEATCFCAYGYEATCVCLPLGNYHNMGDLAAVQAGTNTSPSRVAPEFISLSDFDGLVDLLVGCGESLPAAPSVMPRLDTLWARNSFVLEE